jgi:crotonobetainyl-CoA:carnitine CoA-transferase CaiB-like acyl-CoA transferase
MLEAMTEWMSFPLYYAFEGATPPARVGASHATVFPYGPFAAADGEIMLGVQNEREWACFCTDVLLRPELADDPRFSSNSARSAHREAVREVIEAVFETLPRAVVLERLEAARIANASVNAMADLWSHPQLAARDRWRRVETAFGPIPALLPPGRGDARMGPVPSLGEHGRSILAELAAADDAAEDGTAQHG